MAYVVWLILLIVVSAHADIEQREQQFKALLSDGRLTCEEVIMHKALLVEFRDKIDFGSGARSPIRVDWSCNPLKNTQRFFGKTAEVSALINGIDQPGACSGTITHLKVRNRDWNLAVMGLVDNETAMYVPPMDEEVLKDSIRDSFGWKELDQYNKALHREFVSNLSLESKQFENVMVRHGVSAETARNAAAHIQHAYFTSTFGVGRTPADITSAMRKAVVNNDKQAMRAFLSSSDADEVYQSLRALMLYGEEAGDLLSAITPDMIEMLDILNDDVIALAGASEEKMIALLEAGFNPNRDNDFGKTPLFYAIQFNNLAGAKALIDAGADVNAAYYNKRDDGCSSITGWGRTPLMHAAQHGSIQMVDLLIARGANVSSLDDNGNGVEYYASKREAGNGDAVLWHIQRQNQSSALTYRLDLANAVAIDLERRARLPTSVSLVAQFGNKVAMVYGGGFPGGNAETPFLMINDNGKISGAVSLGGIAEFSPREAKFNEEGDVVISGESYAKGDARCCPSLKAERVYGVRDNKVVRLK